MYMWLTVILHLAHTAIPQMCDGGEWPTRHTEPLAHWGWESRPALTT